MEQIRTWIREQLSIVTDQAWLSFSRRVHLVACGGGDEPQPHELAILRLLQSAGQRRDGKADGEADDKGDEGAEAEQGEEEKSECENDKEEGEDDDSQGDGSSAKGIDGEEGDATVGSRSEEDKSECENDKEEGEDDDSQGDGSSAKGIEGEEGDATVGGRSEGRELDEGDEGESGGKESIEDEEGLWEVIEITAEKSHRYRVRWAGTDPATGRPWRQSWVRREDCTADLVKSWEETTVAKKTVTKQTVASAAMETSQR